MRVSITRALLEHLAESGELLLDALLPRKYVMTWPSRRLLGLDRGRYSSPQAARRSFSSILYRLQAEGLVIKRATGSWNITSKGRSYLKSHRPYTPGLYKRIRTILPSDGVVRLVTFDVPERERSKREWLRRELVACGYEGLHKSVFLGTRPLPEEFMREIDVLKLADCCHIVRITGTGTLQKKRISNR